MRKRRWRLASALAVLFVAAELPAQESPAPTPASTPARGTRISFLPPPLEGTFSLGIYDLSGKLVRVLHREADLDEFEIGNDSLSTAWDGKNDAGESLPAGKYHARGYAVGDVEVEGVGYFFNDWMTSDDSPRVQRIDNLRATREGLQLMATLQDGSSAVVQCDATGAVVSVVREEPGRFTEALEPERATARVENGTVLRHRAEGWERVTVAGVSRPIAAAAGKDDTLWVIDASDSEADVMQFSSDGAVLRRLSISRDDPQPRLIAASEKEERLFLLEENDSMQRVRALTLVATKTDAGQQVSDWKVEFEKKITAHAEFAIEGGKPVAGKRGGDAVEKVKIRLVPNPLQNDKTAEVELIAGFDNKGAVLKTADGLPLQTISETAGLKRVVLAKSGEKSLNLFQDDGAVVEQFRVGNLDQMMAFDCGEFELK